MAMVSVLTELDARHLCPVTLAVTGLQDARVSAVPRGEPRTDLLKELVRRLALLDVAAGEPAGVQRARARLGDELLDERPELLRLRLGGLDRLGLDERGREVPHQRELLFARAAELTSSLPVTHWCYSSSSSGAAAAAWLGGVPQSSTRTPSPFSSNRIPKFKPSRSSRSAISWSDFFPKFFTCRIWLSVWRTRSPRLLMLEFLSEFTDRTESSRSSIGVLSSCCIRAPSVPAPSPAPPATGAELCEPNSTKYWKCVCASAAA